MKTFTKEKYHENDNNNIIINKIPQYFYKTIYFK